MLYSAAGLLSLVLNCILNSELIRHFRFRTRGIDFKKQVKLRYTHFLLAANCYFVTDIIWGIVYEHHDVPQLFPILYPFIVLYFLFMLLTMLTWTRYIVSYLNKNGRRSNILLFGAWTMFALGVLCLVLNQFYQFIFSLMMSLSIFRKQKDISFLSFRLYSTLQ